VTLTIKTTDLKNLFKSVWHHLTRRRQNQFRLLLGLMLISAFVEVVSLGAVVPFLAVLATPDVVFNHPIVVSLAYSWGLTSSDQLVLPMVIGFAVIALIAGIIRVLLLWVNTRLAFSSGTDMSKEIYYRTLHQPYSVHLARNSSELLSGITNKVHSVIFGVLLPLLTFISSAVLLVSISFALFAINPMVASIVTIVFSATYGMITWFSHKWLDQNGKLIASELTQAVKVLQEGLGCIRDVLLDGTQKIYCNTYEKADRRLKKAQGNNVFIGSFPRFMVETLAMVLIAALVYGLSHENGGISNALPVLGAMALGAQRLLPALQQCYGSWASIIGNQASLVDIVELLDQPLQEKNSEAIALPSSFSFQKTVQFNAVRFRYSENSHWVLNDISLTIRKGERVGIVGSTGCGKSTLMDLLMGLLIPTEGKILIDDQVMSQNQIRAWQSNIAHVPQSIYLTDGTIAENIALCLEPNDINMKRLQEVTCQAQIAEFIESQPRKFDSQVGERGIRLSGGQSQRIGIARSLYKQASILVFDEATSALDNTTEKEVMSSIEGLKRDLTILIISHRITTVRHCDVIVELDRGRVVAQGTFEQLIQNSPSFRGLAKSMEVEKN
jgi:ATP-binding cassette, subfamily B, bacterial PglK